MLISRQKKIIIIAGPNGAGKTTFAMECPGEGANDER
jgi:ABC-type Mn2+/Zn2+ transport system ATPase subunit